MINFEMQVNSERLAAQYRDQLLFLLNQVEEISSSYVHALIECDVPAEVLDNVDKLSNAVSNYKVSQRG